ncbi:nitrophenyl compound nitroreductase subunit ArsF family protein [Sunxiuqinia sp. A32]|uniref:nitrophenyl compound nitroreductase subunit ArsF family protein n=1 Tax=Sunxiuqinia sp. A32 TaxID=3461496 RepID=UPI004045B8FE
MRIKIQILFLLAAVLFACTQNKPIKSDDPVLPDKGQIGVYYFRTSIRCETCNTIEQLIKEELNGKYADNVKGGEIVFRQYNIDDAEIEDFALAFNVVFKSLIIIKDEKQINLTNDAFLYALPKPEKFKSLFEETLDKL